MLNVADPDASGLEAMQSGAAPVEAPAAGVDARVEKNVSKTGANSQDMAFETRMSAYPSHPESRGSGETGLREGVLGAMAGSLLAKSRERSRDLPANSRDSPRMAG